MGTSNWQNIPYCAELLRAIDPKRVLDVGIGFGRWGIMVREFCDVWNGRVHPADWTTHVVGIEAFSDNIQSYHESFYDEIHNGDAKDILPTLKERWDLTIFGDVLEHFTKEEGKRLLHQALEHSDYVLVVIPLGENWEQGEAYGNIYERHLSEWHEEDFETPLVTQRLFTDYVDRPFGAFLLGRRDVKRVGRKFK